jgi:hypothetical protein
MLFLFFPWKAEFESKYRPVFNTHTHIKYIEWPIDLPTEYILTNLLTGQLTYLLNIYWLTYWLVYWLTEHILLTYLLTYLLVLTYLLTNLLTCFQYLDTYLWSIRSGLKICQYYNVDHKCIGIEYQAIKSKYKHQSTITEYLSMLLNIGSQCVIQTQTWICPPTSYSQTLESCHLPSMMN